MENLVLNTISKRSTYRGDFANQSIPKDELKAIMQAGLDAPSGCNLQTTSLVAVDDIELLEKVKEEIGVPRLKNAPAIICVFTQEIMAFNERCFNVQDYSAAIQNMLLAIKSLGYEGCWIEGKITDNGNIGVRLANLFKLPEDYKLACVIPVGVASDEITYPTKKAFEERAWFNGYKNKE